MPKRLLNARRVSFGYKSSTVFPERAAPGAVELCVITEMTHFLAEEIFHDPHQISYFTACRLRGAHDRRRHRLCRRQCGRQGCRPPSWPDASPWRRTADGHVEAARSHGRAETERS